MMREEASFAGYWRIGITRARTGNDFPVFDTVHGKVGLGICSKVYMPEVSRALALRGAETPFCGTKQGLLSQWQRPELYDMILPRPLPAAAE